MPHRPKFRAPRSALWGAALGVLALAVALPGRNQASAAPAAAPPAAPAAKEAKDAAKAEPASTDPVALHAQAREALAAGDKDKAKKLFQDALDHEEYGAYVRLKGQPWQKAALLELLGDTAGADAAWQESFSRDLTTPLSTAAQFVGPARFQELLARARAQIDDRLKRLAAGETVDILINAKGEHRPLELLDGAAALEKLKKGEDIKYAYIPELDLSGQTFDKDVVILRSVIGKVRGFDSNFQKLAISATLVLDELRLGKSWKGKANQSAAIPPARFAALDLRESVFFCPAGLEGVRVERLGNLPFVTFAGPADLRNVEFRGAADFRFVTFAQPAQLRGTSFDGSTYFGGSRYLADVDLSGLRARARPVYFNSARFFGKANFDSGDFERGITFEGTEFLGETALTRLHARDRLLLNRVRATSVLRLDEVDAEALDAFGLRAEGPLSLADAVVRGSARFALDSGQRRRFADDPAALPRLYRIYQGDEDADEALLTGPGYGVRSPDDLTSVVLGNLSLANLNVRGRLVMEGVNFGAEEKPGSFTLYGARINETHLERTTVYGRLDLSAMAGAEVSLNGATINEMLVLDNVNITGRVSLSDTTLAKASTISFWGASIGAFQISKDQVQRDDGSRTLFYESCSTGGVPNAATDARLAADLEGKKPEKVCFDRAMDEYSTLQDAFGKQSLAADHDWAYWNQRHYSTLRDLREGSLVTRLGALVQWVIFEQGFGWGVRLGNILATAIVLSILFAFIYRWVCHDTEVKFSGDHFLIKDMTFMALFTMSLQSLIGANIGWEVSGKDRRFKYVNTVITIIGVILITFFVGAYTRMVLA